jgi:transcriptional regulator with XRE-family HTH domain
VNETLVQYLKRCHRQHHDVDKSRIARGAGIKRQTYSAIMHGQTIPGKETLKKIAKAWGFPEHYLTRYAGLPSKTAAVGFIVLDPELIKQFMGTKTDKRTYLWVKQTLEVISDTMDRWQAYHHKKARILATKQEEQRLLREDDKRKQQGMNNNADAKESDTSQSVDDDT